MLRTLSSSQRSPADLLQSLTRLALAAWSVVVALLLTAQPALAQTPDEIFVADPVTTEILRVNPTTGVQTLITSGNNLKFPNGIAIDANGQLIVISIDPNPADRMVVRVNPTNGNQQVISSAGNFSQPFGLAIDSTGNILVRRPGRRHRPREPEHRRANRRLLERPVPRPAVRGDCTGALGV